LYQIKNFHKIIEIPPASIRIKPFTFQTCSIRNQFDIYNSILKATFMINSIDQSCIEACWQCVTACHNCAKACTKETDIKAMAKCITLNMECAILCTAVAELLSMESYYSRQLIKICAELCTICAEECFKHHHTHSQHCAKLCEQCAIVCNKIAA
jgi:hypothetical protein